MRNTAGIIFLALFSFAFPSCNRNAASQGKLLPENTPPVIDTTEPTLTLIPSVESEPLEAAEVAVYDAENDFETRYIDGGKAVEITGYKGSKSEVSIPPQIQGLPVTFIGDSAFAGKELTGVTIPDSVTFIWDSAFAGNQLTSITIPSGVTLLLYSSLVFVSTSRG
jgi:hypothetical protein